MGDVWKQMETYGEYLKRSNDQFIKDVIKRSDVQTRSNSNSKRTRMYMEQNRQCYYCKRQCVHPQFDLPRNPCDLTFTLDHKTPQSGGGTWANDNLVGACRECNTTRGNIPFVQWLELIKLPYGEWKMAARKLKRTNDSSVDPS